MSARLKIASMYPELLNLYGDCGNVAVLKKRCEWRGIEAEVADVRHDAGAAAFGDVDIVLIGGAGDREQGIACELLRRGSRELRAFAEDGGVVLAVCAGMQMLGRSYATSEGEVEGLGLLDLWTEHAEERVVGNVLLETKVCEEPVVGYANHAGRTYLGAGAEPFGRVLHGLGNDGTKGAEGCLWRNVLGTYLHGPLLPKNPGVADWLLARALERRYGSSEALTPLDDSVELAANRVMAQRMRDGEE